MNGALLNPEEVRVTDATVTGGKGRQLAQLRHFGLPVPDFAVLPAAWSEGRGEAFPAALVTALHDGLAARGWLEQPLAVRSSAVGEDSAAASFAGIYTSCLNVQGLDGVVAAVQTVWASLDSDTARAYRARMGHAGPARMGVIVMPLLAAEASGIGFTCDPMTGREDRLVIHANRGLGETLVGGETAGDEYVFAEDVEDAWRLIECRPGPKTCMSVPAPGGGTRRVALPDAAAAPLFDTERAEALAALLRDAAVAMDFVAPFYDLEWVWDGARFWLTQARPVTRRPRHAYGPLQAQPAIWTRGNTCEVMPEPLQPADWNFSRRGVNDLLVQGYVLAGFPVLAGAQRAGLFEGRLYLEASLLQWEAWDAIGMKPERLNALMGGHQPAIDVTPPGGRERLRRALTTLRYLVRAPALRRRGEAEIAAMHALARQVRQGPPPRDRDALRRLLYTVSRPGRTSIGAFFLQGSGGASLSFLVERLEHFFPGEGEALGAALLTGGTPSVTAQQGYDLLRLARLARAAGFPAQVPAQGDYARAFAEFMEVHGHRGHYETYMHSASWRERPERLLEQLPALAEVDEAALRARQQDAAAAAWQRVRREVPFWHRPLLRSLVKAARRECNQREAARSGLIALLEVCRMAWRLAADLLRADGALAERDDVFFVLPSEAERAVDGLVPPAGLRARVAARKALYEAWQAVTPPEYLCIAPAGEWLAAPAWPAPPHRPGEGWRGVATGTGRARGRARILRHPSEGSRLQAGEILVAPSTDPGWTPLFLKAAGLVVETGGYMSHGAIVAREFALPAVVNLPGILDGLQDGDEVEVDGRSGEVRLIRP
ncbi:MAG TPA: PEP/pyruvate-binding domain-containing protein [Rhodocyclaceae bacterium]|nr:PEP/pyruvate-binding domain-containing protein [Rhodocyclaceae bacterium]